MTTATDELFLSLQAALAGRYSLERELGRGGMGIVYLARDVRLDRPVALKLLPPERAARPELRERFLREARLAARLAHPNIVPIHAVEEAGPFVFYAMRYVAGETLGARLRRAGHLAPADTARVLRDVAYALAYAHAQRVIHRDIKPDNILLEIDGDRAVVTDFGIAHVTDGIDDHRGRVVGTPEYLAPEQASGDAVDGRSDLYSLGAVGFHCLAGHPPFEGDTPQLLAQRLTADAPPVRDVAPATPSALADAVDRALARNPRERHATAEGFAEAIEAMLTPRGELPVPVRIWVERGRELRGVYVIWSCFFYGVGTMAFVGGMIGGRWSLQTIVFILLCASATVAPWIGHALWRLSETRKAIEAGASLDDLRNGTIVSLHRREEERRYESARAIHPIARLVRWATYVAFAGSVAALAGGVLLRLTPPQPGLFFRAFGAATMLTVGGALFGLVFPGRRLKPRDVAARLRCWFWHSALGDLMARIAALGLPGRREHRWSSAAATETTVGALTETLFAALPERERGVLADLPDIVARLEAEARRARRQLAAGDDPGWAERLQRSVAAIESLRVGLLRVTTGHVAAGTLTAELDAARELSERIGYLVAGSEAVADILESGIRSRQSSTQAMPALSPPSTSLG